MCSPVINTDLDLYKKEIKILNFIHKSKVISACGEDAAQRLSHSSYLVAPEELGRGLGSGSGVSQDQDQLIVLGEVRGAHGQRCAQTQRPANPRPGGGAPHIPHTSSQAIRETIKSY